MEKIIVSKWDMADYIESKEEVIAHIEAALEENDTEFLFNVLGDIARSEGMTKIAKELNLSRENLYRSLSAAGNPSFSTVLRVLDMLGFKLRVEQKHESCI
jgi:probable addiction module antidote protein